MADNAIDLGNKQPAIPKRRNPDGWLLYPAVEGKAYGYRGRRYCAGSAYHRNLL